MIKLYPPFLYQDETSDFDEVWENFCRQILQLDIKTNNIIKRVPPESGVDLFWPDQRIAYQCKSTASGTGSTHNLTKIFESYNQAINIKESLGWEKYVLCLNYDLTGNQYDNIKEKLPDVEILTNSYWADRARKYFSIVKSYFRIILTLREERINNSISESFVPRYSARLKELLNQNSIKIFVWCNRNKSLYDLNVSPDFTVEDLLYIIKKAWPYSLPKPKEIGPYELGLSYSLVFNDQKLTFDKTLADLNINENDIITFWTTITYSDKETTQRKGDFIEMISLNRINSLNEVNISNLLSSKMTKKEAIEIYNKEIEDIFKKIDLELRQETK